MCISLKSLYLTSLPLSRRRFQTLRRSLDTRFSWRSPPPHPAPKPRSAASEWSVNTFEGLKDSTWKSRPKCGFDCLICATFAVRDHAEFPHVHHFHIPPRNQGLHDADNQHLRRTYSDATRYKTCNIWLCIPFQTIISTFDNIVSMREFPHVHRRYAPPRNRGLHDAEKPT